jgi:hypothetical protein
MLVRPRPPPFHRRFQYSALGTGRQQIRPAAGAGQLHACGQRSCNGFVLVLFGHFQPPWTRGLYPNSVSKETGAAITISGALPDGIWLLGDLVTPSCGLVVSAMPPHLIIRAPGNNRSIHSLGIWSAAGSLCHAKFLVTAVPSACSFLICSSGISRQKLGGRLCSLS